jgi:hypothetical protein
MVHEGTRQPILVSWAVRRAQVPSNAIHRSLPKVDYYGTLEGLAKERLPFQEMTCTISTALRCAIRYSHRRTRSQSSPR